MKKAAVVLMALIAVLLIAPAAFAQTAPEAAKPPINPTTLELSQDFDVAVLGRPHPSGCDEFRERLLCVDREQGRLQVLCKFFGRGFPTPKSTLSQEIGLPKAVGLGLESPQIQLRAQRDGIVGDPLFEHPFRVEQPANICVFFEIEESACCEILHI